MSDVAVEKAKEEILKYLRKHPDASDNLEGIARFWVTRERIEAATETVEQAIDALMKEGLLKKVVQRSSSGTEESVRFRIISSASDHRSQQAG